VSRVGKKSIEIPKGVTVTTSGETIKVKGPKGELSRGFPPLVEVEVADGKIQVKRTADNRQGRAMHGLARSLINNMVIGVSQGFTRVLEINGVGYRADSKKGVLTLALGYSHPIELMLPEGVEAKVDRNRIMLSGSDKEVLGQFAAVVRDQRGPEPYKGKGIKYEEEHIRRKVGKAGVG
jgi:large subunit ribosomal protein L6